MLKELVIFFCVVQARNKITLLRSDGLRTPVEATISDVDERRRSSHVNAAIRQLRESAFIDDVIQSFFLAFRRQ